MASTNADSTNEDSKSAQETCQLDDFIKNGFRTFVEATKVANDLPKNRDYDFYNTHSSFSTALNTESDRLLHMINRVLNVNDIAGNIKSASLACKEDLIGEANDVILDRAVASIDEMNGLKSLPAAPVIQTVSANILVSGSWNRVNKITVNEHQNEMTRPSHNSIHLLTAKNIVRPQSYFKDKVENGNNNPWKPRITEKPNSLKPLALYLEPSEVNETFEEWSHPYEYELEHFKVPEEFLVKVDEPQAVRSVIETPLYEITTEEQLHELVEELRKHKEIAVDLEHHSYRSFQGITCLMQISTRDADYLVDTLILRHKLFVLNEIFTKPSILKIFHGADMDIQWLQRDLSLYIVNMFDTHQAAKTLGYSGLSLAYLLNRFCFFMPNKKFQLADWRIRPMPQALKDYAREDTHYLIYVYEMLKKELYKQAHDDDNLLRAVFQASTEVCKIRYIKPRWTLDAHFKLCQRRKKMFDNRQMHALKEIYKWRDGVARDLDESTGYVLPNHMMLQIAEMLPREVQGILACCSPIPPLVRAHSLELHHIILRAREQPIEKPIMQESNRRIVSKEVVRLNIDSPLHCPHDLTKQDNNDNLPTLLDISTVKDVNADILPLEQVTSSCKIFNDTPLTNRAARFKPNFTFLGPFERYKLIRPFLQAEEQKDKVDADAKDKAENDPSVNDRIAALHEHFVQVRESLKHEPPSAEVLPLAQCRDEFSEPLCSVMSLDTTKPLISMAGSKKRKRDVSIDPVDRFGTVIAGDDGEEERNEANKYVPTGNDSKRHKGNRGKKSRYNDRSGRDDEHFNRDKTKRNKDWNNSPRGGSNHRGNHQRGGKDYRGGKHQRGGKDFQDRGAPSQPYDYSKVDYSQFSGGGRNVGHKQVETKHRGKGQNKRGGRGGRGHNQSMTFQPTRGRGSYQGRK